MSEIRPVFCISPEKYFCCIKNPMYADFPRVCYEDIYRVFDVIKPSGKVLEG